MPSVERNKSRRHTAVPYPLNLKHDKVRYGGVSQIHTPPLTGSVYECNRLRSAPATTEVHFSRPCTPCSPLHPSSSSSSSLPLTNRDVTNDYHQYDDDCVTRWEREEEDGQDCFAIEHESPADETCDLVESETQIICDPFRDARVPDTYVRTHMTHVARAYFNSRQGATVYIRARPISRSSTTTTDSKDRLVVRIVPRDPQNAPFLMSTPFKSSPPPPPPSSSSSSSSSEEVKGEEETVKERSSPILPFHIEVALLRAPVLAELLLCGKIRRGDLVELELPDPNIFTDLIYWIYTGTMRIGHERTIANHARLFLP